MRVLPGNIRLALVSAQIWHLSLRNGIIDPWALLLNLVLISVHPVLLGHLGNLAIVVDEFSWISEHGVIVDHLARRDTDSDLCRGVADLVLAETARLLFILTSHPLLLIVLVVVVRDDP